MLARTVNRSKSLMFWNVRATPRRAIVAAAARVMSRPSSVTRPPVGWMTPEMQFSSVVLPEPFGPIKPKIRPSSRSSETPRSAVTPPKSLATSTAPSIARAAGRVVCSRLCVTIWIHDGRSWIQDMSIRDRTRSETEPATAAALVDEIANAIRSDVARGRFPTGSRLRQEALAADFGVSRTPIREALRKLQAEGLVVLLPRRGALVRRPTPREIREAYRVRAEIEGLAAELAAAWITDDERRELRSAERLFKDVVDGIAGVSAQRGEIDTRRVAAEWMEANDRFHEVIQRAARNAALRNAIVFLHRSIPRGLTGFALASNRRLLQQNVREHAGIRRAIDRRERDRARTLMRDHVQRSGEIAAAWFELQEAER
jgi:DNA-binding GntR family transcriptional regulator